MFRLGKGMLTESLPEGGGGPIGRLLAAVMNVLP